MSSTRTDTLFYAADLRSGVVGLPPDVSPPAVWLDLPGESHPVPAWPLTPQAHSALWLACVRLEDRWREGDYPDAKIATVWERWGRIDAWATSTFGEAELLAARARAEAVKRPSPPPLGNYLYSPFRDWPEPTHWPGMSKAGVKAEREKAKAKPRRAVKRKAKGGLFG